MTPLVWANLPLALLPVLAWAWAVPLWMIFKRPDTAPDFSDAYDYRAAHASLSLVNELESGRRADRCRP